MKYSYFQNDVSFSYYFHRKKNDPLEFGFANIFTFLHLSYGELIVSLPHRTLTVRAGEMLFLSMHEARTFSIGECESIKGKVFCFRYWPNVTELDFPSQVFCPTDAATESLYAFNSFSTDDSPINCQIIYQCYRFIAHAEPLMIRNADKNFENIKRVWKYMQVNSNCTIPKLVEISGMSKSRFYVAFLKIVGYTPIEIKHAYQAYQAEMLLKNTNLNIEDIAHKVGFYSTAHFRKVFEKRYNKRAPHKFRKDFAESKERL